jgi:hypothetical protein
MKHRFSQARQGWHICSLVIHQPAKLRQERHHGGRLQRPDDVAPTGLKIILVWGSTNMPRQRRFGRDIARRCPRWRFPIFGQRNFCLPAGDRKARAGGRRSAPSLPRRDAGNGHRDGRAPQPSPSWWPCASTGQWQFGVDERRFGRDIARRCPRRRFPAFGRRNFEPPARRGQESAGRRMSQRAIPAKTRAASGLSRRPASPYGRSQW